MQIIRAVHFEKDNTRSFTLSHTWVCEVQIQKTSAQSHLVFNQAVTFVPQAVMKSMKV